jgi:hypothetical protein
MRCLSGLIFISESPCARVDPFFQGIAAAMPPVGLGSDMVHRLWNHHPQTDKLAIGMMAHGS